jgi:chromosome partitioning protein
VDERSKPQRNVLGPERRSSLPPVVDEHQAALVAREHEHLIIDTKARPEPQDLKALALGCHLLIIPVTPDPLSLEALMLTVSALQSIGAPRGTGSC